MTNSDEVIPFRPKKPPVPPAKTVKTVEIEQVGLLTSDDKRLYITDPETIVAIWALVVRRKTKVYEEK